VKVHREHARTLLALLTWQLLFPLAAGAYTVKLRWDAPGDSAVAGYRLYVREDGGDYGAPRDVVPESAPDGLTTSVGDLAIEHTYTFALTAYTADGRESARSNERTIGYPEAAAVVDSDGDGLTDAAEDVNLNGVQDPGETDRFLADSDGDLVPDGVERARGTDPLDPLSPACDALPFADFGFGRGGVAEVAYEPALGDTVLRATTTARAPLRFNAVYPARGSVGVAAAVFATELRSARRFRIEVVLRSTRGRRYTLRYEGNGGADRRAGRTLTVALGGDFAGDGYVAIGRDLVADLARLDPNAELATITRIRLRGEYTTGALQLCQ
jgi:Fibronectin type III domain